MCYLCRYHPNTYLCYVRTWIVCTAVVHMHLSRASAALSAAGVRGVISKSILRLCVSDSAMDTFWKSPQVGVRSPPPRGMINMKGIERRAIPVVFKTSDYFPTDVRTPLLQCTCTGICISIFAVSIPFRDITDQIDLADAGPCIWMYPMIAAGHTYHVSCG